MFISSDRALTRAWHLVGGTREQVLTVVRLSAWPAGASVTFTDPALTVVAAIVGFVDAAQLGPRDELVAGAPAGSAAAQHPLVTLAAYLAAEPAGERRRHAGGT
jgi:hypothetical protein